MKRLLPVLLALPLLAPPASAEIEGQLHFINGDRLSGKPGMVNDQGQLIWNAGNLLHQPSEIRLKSILDLRLQGGVTPAVDAKHIALLTLTNGDSVRGQFAGLDEEYVTLDTWYGGQLRIRRTMASALEVMRSERALFRGPDSLDNWTISGDEDAWSFHNGQLISHTGGCLAREMKLPEKCHLAFDLAWRSNLKFRLLLFSNEGDTATPENCYDLVCQRRFVYLRKRWMTKRSGGSRTIGQPANIRELAEKESVRMDFYIDRAAGSIAFYIDGRQAQVWADDDPDVGSFGDWIHFISEDYPLRISKLRASAWKGDLPEGPEPDEEGEEPGEESQSIRLLNGDKIAGEVGGIEDGKLAIKTKHADIVIPVERIRTVNLADSDYEEPKRMKGDVRGWLREGGRVTFQLRSFAGNKITGYSQTFGEAEFDLNAFSLLEFNIHDEELDSRRSGQEW